MISSAFLMVLSLCAITKVVLFSVSGCYTNIGVKETTELIVVSDDKTSTELRLESKPEKSKKQILVPYANATTAAILCGLISVIISMKKRRLLRILK